MLYTEAILNIINFISPFPYLVSFLAPFLGGEILVMTVAFVGSSGIFPFWTIVFFSFLGMLCLDIFWYFLVKSRSVERFKKSKIISAKNYTLERHLEKISDKNDIIILLLSKILVGTRILIIAYISLRKISFKKFLFYDSIPTFIWAIMLVSLGWFSGASFKLITALFNDIKIAITILVLGGILVYLILKLLRASILKKEKK